MSPANHLKPSFKKTTIFEANYSKNLSKMSSAKIRNELNNSSNHHKIRSNLPP